MLSFRRISNLIFFIGIIVCCIGLVYVLGYSTHSIFRYSASLGFLLLALGILTSIFSKSK